MVSSKISMVLMPPPPKVVNSGKPVAETVAGSADHKSLAAALKQFGLDSVLNGPGPFVLFAPTDAAFKKLPAGASATADILKYHVSTNTQLPSRNGRSYYTLALHPDGDAKEIGVRVTVDTAESFILGGQANKAKVLSTIQTSNGYVHVIDEVLLPYEGKFPPYMAIKEPIPEGYVTPKGVNG
jgi:uncharacterized surface protein with fasciclin (FAS1) repeats